MGNNKKKKSQKKPPQVVETVKEPEIQKVEVQPETKSEPEPAVSSIAKKFKIKSCESRNMSELSSELNKLDIGKEKA